MSSEQQVHSGEWWLAEDPKKKYPGTATFRPGNGWSLRFFGAVPSAQTELAQTLPAVVIHGTTDEFKRLTFPRAVVNGIGDPLFSEAAASTSASARGALVGREYSEDLTFDRFVIGSKPLAHWARRRGMISFDASEEGRHAFSIEEPEAVEISLDTGLLRLEYSAHGKVSLIGFDQTMSTGWSYQPRESADIRTFVNTVFRPLEYLQVILTGHHLGRATVSVFSGQRGWRWISGSTRLDDPDLERRFEWPLPIHEIPELPGLVQKWFSLFNEVGDALHPLMSVFIDEVDHKLETSLLLLFHGVEGYHRRRSLFSDEVVSKEEHRTRIAELTEGKSDAVRDWAAERLRHTNQPSFADRIRELIDYAGPIGDEIAGSPRFASMARDYRDSLAHGLEVGRRRKEHWIGDMHRISRKLTELMRVCLLRDLGLSSEEAATASRRLPSTQFAIAYTPEHWSPSE